MISGYGTLTTRAGAWVNDNGIIRASGGSLQVDGNITGEGAIQIAANSVANLTGGSLTLAGIAFIGADATLSLAQGAKVTAGIAGFALGDIIEMARSTPCNVQRDDRQPDNQRPGQDGRHPAYGR